MNSIRHSTMITEEQYYYKKILAAQLLELTFTVPVVVVVLSLFMSLMFSLFVDVDAAIALCQIRFWH